MFRFIAIIFLVFCFTGCSQNIQNEKFEEFFSHFIIDKSFELSRTKFPLSSYRYEYWVDEKGNEESATIRTEVKKSVVASQLSLSEYISKNGLSSELPDGDALDSVKKVRVFKQSTDWLIEYHFERTNGQWFLVATHDYSL